MLNGAKAGSNATTRPGTAASESVVMGPAGSFNLTANNIVLDGFTVQDANGAPGINTANNRSGYQILNNIIKNNTFGISLNNQGANPALVSRNLFKDNNEAGSASGNGIYSDQRLRNVTIERNKFTGQVNASITLGSIGVNDPVRSNVVIARNEARQERTFANVYSTAGLTISRNDLRDFTPNGSAIFLAGGSSDVLIERNIVRGANFSGIRLRGDFGLGGSTNVNISRNDVRNVGDFGIGLAPGAVTGGRIERNVTRNNATDGIGIDAGNTGLFVERNESFQNAVWDIRDSSSGSGDAGTANQYDRNKCLNDSPDGLCS